MGSFLFRLPSLFPSFPYLVSLLLHHISATWPLSTTEPSPTVVAFLFLLPTSLPSGGGSVFLLAKIDWSSSWALYTLPLWPLGYFFLILSLLFSYTFAPKHLSFSSFALLTNLNSFSPSYLVTVHVTFSPFTRVNASLSTH